MKTRLIAIYGNTPDWLPLGQPSPNPPAAQIPQDSSRFTVWLDNIPIARGAFNQLDTVLELRDFTIADGYIAEYGTSILQAVVELARPRANILTIEFFPPAYSRSFLGAGFRQNTRTRMMKSLANYTPQPIKLPDGIKLRHPIFDDEPAISELAYNNYLGTSEEQMVSGSRAQAAAIIRAMFHNDYNLLNPAGSYLALDPSGNLIADVILGDASNDPTDRIAWIMDISIAQAHRGKGLGKALLLSAINAAHAHGYPRIGLIVTIGNTAAQSLYHSLGFEDYGDIMYEAVLRLNPS